MTKSQIPTPNSQRRPRTKNPTVILLTLLLGFGIWDLGVPPPAAARTGDGGSTSGEFLRLSAGAHAPAVGGAMTASATGADAIFYNPAGLGWLGAGGGREVAATYQSLAGEANYGDLSVAIPAGERGGLSLGVKYVDYGSIDRTTLTTAGLFVTGNRAGSFGAHDLSASIGYGRRWTNLSVGVAGKFVSSQLDDVSATAGAVDAGFQYKLIGLPLRIGATVQNLGSSLKYDLVAEDLPLLGRVGATGTFFRDRLRIHADIEWARNESAAFMGGAEFDVASMLTVRAGYDGRNEADDSPYTVGLGFHSGALSLDYAYAPFGDLGDNHRVGLTLGF
jgi:opacity protein-like surface antigen